MLRRPYGPTSLPGRGGVMAYHTNTRRVFSSWPRAVEVALTYGSQTGWKHKVRQIAARDAARGPVWRVERTGQRIKHARCNPRRERELKRHAT